MKSLAKPNFLKRLFLTYEDFLFAHRDIEAGPQFTEHLSGATTDLIKEYHAPQAMMITGISGRGYESSQGSNTNLIRFKLVKNKQVAITNDYICMSLFSNLAEGYYRLPVPIFLNKGDELDFTFVQPTTTESWHLYLMGTYINEVPKNFPLRPFWYAWDFTLTYVDTVTVAAVQRVLTFYNHFFGHKFHYAKTNASCLVATDRYQKYLDIFSAERLDLSGKSLEPKRDIISTRLEYLGDGTYPMDLYSEFFKNESISIMLRGLPCLGNTKVYFLWGGGINEEG